MGVIEFPDIPGRFTSFNGLTFRMLSKLFQHCYKEFHAVLATPEYFKGFQRHVRGFMEVSMVFKGVNSEFNLNPKLFVVNYRGVRGI